MSAQSRVRRSLIWFSVTRHVALAAGALALLSVPNSSHAQPTAQQVSGGCNTALQNITGSTVNVVMNCLSEALPESNLLRLSELIGNRMLDRLTAGDREKTRPAAHQAECDRGGS